MQREPAVSGQFYPGDPSDLHQTIAALTPKSPEKKERALAVISPHAGYIYSGGVAAETFAKIEIPDTIVILGPNHHGYGAKLAVMDNGNWQMPFGPVTINEQLAKALIDNENIFSADNTAHISEHSLEVQIPFLQYHNPHISIVPICISSTTYANCEEAGLALAQVIKAYGKPTLIVASSDMSHYEPRASATKKDQLAMNQIEKLAPHSLFNIVTTNNISMCGVIPTTVTLIAAKSLGAKKAQLVRYTDSGEVSGDLDQVVGYAGYVIS